MIPISDDNPQINIPYATYSIIALNVLVWFLLQGMGAGEQLGASICRYGLIPADLFTPMAWESGRAICEPGAGSGWLSLISSMFMHGSWAHILGNMLFLWVFGDNVEDSMGSVRFALFYLLCGLGAAAAQIVSDSGSLLPMIGASGAVGGVMGAYLMLYPRVKVHLLIFIMIIRVPAMAMLGYWIVIQVIGGFASLDSTGGGVAFWAHVGGFAAGSLLIWIFKDQELLAMHQYYGWNMGKNPTEILDDPANRQ